MRNQMHSANEASARPIKVPSDQSNNNAAPARRVSSQQRSQRLPQRNTQRVSSQRPVQGMPSQTVRKPAQNPSQRQMQKTSGQASGRTVSKVQVKPQNRPQQKSVQPVRKPVKQAAKPVRETSPMTPQQTGRIVKILIAAVCVLFVGLLAYLTVVFFRNEAALLTQEVTIEAGAAKPDISMYFSEEPRFPKLVSSNLNFNEVNTELPQTIRFNIKMYGFNYPCRLIIADTIPPEGQGIAQKIFASEDLPDAASCITGIEDITDVVVTWQDVPDMSEGGSFIAKALLTDGCGNETVVDVPFEVTKDSQAPEITGAEDIDVYLGDSVSYRGKIVVTDDYDDNPSLDIDTSAVKLNEPGTYEVVYTATDFSGNETQVKVNIRVSEKPEGYVEPEVVYAAAKEILEEITEPGMTDEEVALQIVYWCRYNIRFILRTYSNSWTEAAYNAFTTRVGNCYSTVYAVKALLDVAGIENQVIERYPYETATHFWNYVKLNGQWYHCDATWREGYDSYFFMYTTEELLDFWQGGWNGFQFDQDKFPESATESVQSRIDYKNHTIESP